MASVIVCGGLALKKNIFIKGKNQCVLVLKAEALNLQSIFQFKKWRLLIKTGKILSISNEISIAIDNLAVNSCIIYAEISQQNGLGFEKN